MAEWLYALIGLAVGAGALALLILARRNRLQSELTNVRTRNELLDEQIGEHLKEIKDLRADLAEASTERDHAQGKIALLTQQVEALDQQLAEQKKLLEEARTAFGGAFEALRADLPEEHRHELVGLARQHFKPIQELLETQETALSKIERRREKLYAQLGAQIKDIADSHRQLETQTGRLVTALRRPEVRGQWGEIQLQNLVELAGMTKHCDFNTQPPTEDPSSRKRPDMTVRMPGGGVLILDSKVALDHFINTIVEPDADRESELSKHAAAVEGHVRGLAERKYQDEYEKSPDFVLMFVRVEAALAAAYEVKPDLIERAMEKHVIIVTPSTLFVTLQTIAYWWRQEDIADNARSIADTGRELYDRLATFVSHFEGIGKAIKGAGIAYDSAVGSLERRILPSARSLKELHATTKPQIESPRVLRIETRPVTSTELTQQAGQ